MDKNIKTLSDAIKHFADEQVCIDTITDMRWSNGPECPVCASGAARQHWLKTQKRWQCRDCGKQFSVKVNTIFEDSAIRLEKWLTAMWMLANCKNGVSSYEIHRSIGVTQKSAWFMLQRIRLAMKNQSILKLGSSGGPVEVDESFHGGNPKNWKISKRVNRKRFTDPETKLKDTKTAVVGLLDRETRQVRAKVIPNVSREILQDVILDSVVGTGTVYTDGWKAYSNLKDLHFVHETVNHLDEYVRGDVHTNGIENFWALLKRGLKGTYVAVEPFHLEKYADEQVFRFNNRATKRNPLTDADRFLLLLSQIAGKRLTYAELTGKVGETAF